MKNLKIKAIEELRKSYHLNHFSLECSLYLAIKTLKELCNNNDELVEIINILVWLESTKTYDINALFENCSDEEIVEIIQKRLEKERKQYRYPAAESAIECLIKETVPFKEKDFLTVSKQLDMIEQIILVSNASASEKADAVIVLHWFKKHYFDEDYMKYVFGHDYNFGGLAQYYSTSQIVEMVLEDFEQNNHNDLDKKADDFFKLTNEEYKVLHTIIQWIVKNHKNSRQIASIFSKKDKNKSLEELYYTYGNNIVYYILKSNHDVQYCWSYKFKEKIFPIIEWICRNYNNKNTMQEVFEGADNLEKAFAMYGTYEMAVKISQTINEKEVSLQNTWDYYCVIRNHCKIENSICLKRKLKKDSEIFRIMEAEQIFSDYIMRKEHSENIDDYEMVIERICTFKK